MRFRKVTVENAVGGKAKTQDCMEIEIIINENIYKVSERFGELHIRVDGQAQITPIANNCISVKENK